MNKRGLKLPSDKPRRIVKNAEWYKNRGNLLDQENEDLRTAIYQFCNDLEQGGLPGRLLSRELRSRLAKIKRYA